jgi:hypothetical protein
MKTLYESILDNQADILSKSDVDGRAIRLHELGWDIGDIIVSDTYKSGKRYCSFHQITKISDTEKDSVIARQLITIYDEYEHTEYPMRDMFHIDKWYPDGDTLLFQFTPQGKVRRIKVANANTWMKKDSKTTYWKYNKGELKVDLSYN